MTITAEEAQVRSLDIFATTDGKPIFFKFNLSLWAVWLIILSLATRQDFLDESSHLYKRVCLSVGPSVCPSVMHFILIAKMKVFCHVCHQKGPDM